MAQSLNKSLNEKLREIHGFASTITVGFEKPHIFWNKKREEWLYIDIEQRSKTNYNAADNACRHLDVFSNPLETKHG